MYPASFYTMRCVKPHHICCLVSTDADSLYECTGFWFHFHRSQIMLTTQMIALWGHQFHTQPMIHWTDSLYSMLQQFHMDYLYKIFDISVPCLYKKWTADSSEYSGYGLLGCDSMYFVRQLLTFGGISCLQPHDHLFCSKGRNMRFLLPVDTYLPNCVASHPRWL